jgi:hypothetical protein
MTTTSFVEIPDGTGRITERSRLWDQLIEATLNGVALRIEDVDAQEAKRIVNAMSHRVRKQMPDSKLRTRWVQAEQVLTLWIQK